MKNASSESSSFITHIVTKENFIQLLNDFKLNIGKWNLEYIIFNIDMSSPENIENPYNQIIFCEISLCLKNENFNNDIPHNVITYLIPSLKFHKFISEEFISLSSITMRYLSFYKESYDFSLVSDSMSISYSEDNREGEMKKNLEQILKEGKQSKKENKKSYYYYPKAFYIHSKKFQKKYVEVLSNFTKDIIKEYRDYKFKKEETQNLSIVANKNVKLTNNDNDLITEIFKFKWNTVFQPFTSEMLSMYIRKIKIEIKNKGDEEKFIKFIDGLLSLCGQGGNNSCVPTDFEDAFYAKWASLLSKYFLISTPRNGKVEMSICTSHPSEIPSWVNNLLKVMKNLNKSSEAKFNSQIIIENYLPLSMQKNVVVSYKFGFECNFTKFEIDETKPDSDFTKKISYAKIYVENNDSENILFGYDYRSEIYYLFDSLIQNNYSLEKKINKLLACDLQNFKEEEKFSKLIKDNFNLFKLEQKEKNDYYLKVKIEPSQLNDKLKSSLCEFGEEIKKRYVILYEMGVSIFIKEMVKVSAKKGKIIFGSKLEERKQFISKLIGEPELKWNIIDISVLCERKNIPFSSMYYQLGKEVKYVTQKLYYIVDEGMNKDSSPNQTKKEKIYFDEFYFKENYSKILRIFREIGNFWINSKKSQKKYEIDFCEPSLEELAKNKLKEQNISFK